jgi:predicted dehydrogenase
LTRFGIIGTNWITEAFLAAGRELEHYEAAAVYSRSPERADAYASKHGIPHRYSDLQSFVASERIDAVYIASPNALHAEQAMLCMEHGKHVLCEKPLASNRMEAERMAAAAERNGVLLMEAMKTTYLPNFEAIQELLPKIGKVRRFFGSYCQYSSRYDAYRAGEVLNAFNPTLSNGALMDLGVYCIHPAIQLFGPPQQVKSNGMLLSSGADGLGSLLLQYDGMEAVLMYSKISHSTIPCEIQGEDGNIVFDKMSEPTRVELQYRDGRTENYTRTQSERTMRYEIEAFIDGVRSGKREPYKERLDVSLHTLAVMDEARRQMDLVFPADRAE